MSATLCRFVSQSCGGKIVSRQDSDSVAGSEGLVVLCPLAVNSEHGALMTGSILGK